MLGQLRELIVREGVRSQELGALGLLVRVKLDGFWKPCIGKENVAVSTMRRMGKARVPIALGVGKG